MGYDMNLDGHKGRSFNAFDIYVANIVDTFVITMVKY